MIAKRMNKIKLLLIVLLIATLSFTGCTGPVYVIGNERQGFEFAQDLNAKLESDKFIFDKNDVTLDFYYCFYCLDYVTLEHAWLSKTYILTQGNETQHFEAVYAIYLSKNKDLIFEEDKLGNLVDFQNKVNAQMLKFISYEDSFNTNYGYTTLLRPFLKINYNHKEQITIPAELFSTSNDPIYIHVLSFVHNIDTDKYYNENSFDVENLRTLEIKYKLLGENTVMLSND